MHASRGRRVVGYTVLVVSLMLWIEVASLVALLILAWRGIPYDPIDPSRLPPLAERALVRLLAGEPSYLVPDSALGWTIRAGATSEQLYHSTPEGLRAPSPSGAQIAAFGDSFTHGDDVADSAAWASRLRARNYGVPGYGLDQAYLRYLTLRPPARYVLIGYMSENVNRTVSVFRPFYSPRAPQPFAKPRFRLAGDTLVLVRNPLPTLAHYRALLANPATFFPLLGEHDLFWHQHPKRSRWDVLATARLLALVRAQPARWASPLDGSTYRVKSEGFRVTVALFDAFVRAVRQEGAEPKIVFLPHLTDLTVGPTYAVLRDTLASRGYHIIDVWEGLTACRPEPARCFGERYHYNEYANQLVANYIEAQLGQHQRAAARAGGH